MSNIKVGITQGDINGISYEVILKTLEDSRISELCTHLFFWPCGLWDSGCVA